MLISKDELYAKIENLVKKDYVFENPVNLTDYAEFVRYEGSSEKNPKNVLPKYSENLS